MDVIIEEIKNVLNFFKPNKSLGEDEIISEFYITHWEQIKDEFFLLVNDTFDKKELTPSQYKGVLTLLYTSGEQEDIRNWRPLTLLNSDYKIIAKILAERLKVVLPKLIHSDQKGFVKGRNINEANRLIQDVIYYTDREDDDGIIIFLDQQKTFDRVEWGWVDHVLSKFNFGEQFRELVQMLFKYAQTCIKTNGFVSKYFNISRSCRQGFPIAPLVYILQAEPVACAIRGIVKYKGSNYLGEKMGNISRLSSACLQMTLYFIKMMNLSKILLIF